MKHALDRPSRLRYTAILLGISFAIVLAALASLRRALEANLGPLEGVSMSADGTLAAEPPLRVVIVDSREPDGGAAVSPVEELETWKRLTALPNLQCTVSGPRHLPKDPAQADVVIVPWGQTLQPADFEALLDYLESGGGVVLGGPMAPSPATEAARPRGETGPGNAPSSSERQPGTRRLEYSSILRDLFVGAGRPGQAGSPSHPPSHDRSYETGTNAPGHAGEPARRPALGARNLRIAPVAGDLLEFLLPAGYRLEVPQAVVSRGRATCRRPLAEGVRDAPTGRWHGRCIMGAVEREKGRAIWLGFPLSQVFGAPDSTARLQTMVAGLLRWTGGRPVLTLNPWPGAQRDRVSVAVAADDPEGIVCLDTMFREGRVRPTWFVPMAGIRGDPRLVEALAASGEVALLAPANLLEAGVTERRRFLVDAAAALKPRVGTAPPGVLVRSSDRPAEALFDLAMAGFDYLFSPRRTSSFHPARIEVRGRQITLLPAPLIDLGRPIETPGDLGLTAVERLERALPARTGGPLSIVLLRSGGACEPAAREQLEALVNELTDAARYAVAPLGTMVSRWTRVQAVRVRCQALRENRLHLRVSGAESDVPGLDMHLFMAHTAGLGTVDTHQLKPSRLAWEAAGPSRFLLATDVDAGGRTEDFFIERRPARQEN